MVDVSEDPHRQWLTAVGERARTDQIPAGSVLAAVARACAAPNRVGPGATPLLAGAFGDPPQWSEIGPAPPEAIRTPDLVGQAAEVLTAPDDRRSQGVHYTPAPIAERLVAQVVVPDRSPPTVCDPAVGGGAFLLAVARHLVASGHDVRAVVERLAGVDLEPLAVAAAETALVLLAAEHSVQVDPGGLVEADALVKSVDRFPRRPDGGYDLVLGNPPFGGQLRGATRRAASEQTAMKDRFGTAAAAYTDRSSLFLLLALELVRPGGRVQLILPRSMLVARDAGPARERLLRQATLDAVWVDEDESFDAAVRVCAVTATRAGSGRTTAVSGGAAPAVRVPAPRAGDVTASWGSLLATTGGIPVVELVGPALGSIASATAGFRQHYYGLVPFVREEAAGAGMPLVTSGLIEPAEMRWGATPCRFARRRWSAPVVDDEALRVDDPVLGSWLDARRCPKVLVASQTRIIEAVADPSGRMVPSVPVVSVEPTDPQDVWRVAALLLAPATSAWMLHHRAGSGLSADTVRVSARSVTALPLPGHRDHWDHAAELVQQWHAEPADADVRRRFALAACAAQGVSESERVELVQWWIGQVEWSADA